MTKIKELIAKSKARDGATNSIDIKLKSKYPCNKLIVDIFFNSINLIINMGSFVMCYQSSESRYSHLAFNGMDIGLTN